MTIKNDNLLDQGMIPLMPLSQAGHDSARNKGDMGGFAAALEKEMKQEDTSREKASPVTNQNREKTDRTGTDQAQKTTEDGRTEEMPVKAKQKNNQQEGASVQEAKILKKNGLQSLGQQGETVKNAAVWPDLGEMAQGNRKITATAREASIAAQAERINLNNSPDLDLQVNLKQTEGFSRENGLKQPENQNMRSFEQEQGNPEKNSGEKIEIVNRSEVISGPEENHIIKENQGTNLQLNFAEGIRATADSRLQPQAKLAEGIPFSSFDRGQIPELVLRRVEDAVLMLLNRNDNSLTVKMYPPELGRVQIDMQVRNGGTEIKIMAETPQVREVIQANLEQLRNSMENSGYLLSRLDVEVGGFSRFTHNQGQRRNGSGVSLSGQDGAEETVVEQNENPAAVSDLIRGGRVNLVV